MKKLEQYFIDELDAMRGYIVTYLEDRENQLTVRDGFNLGTIHSFFNRYSLLLKTKVISIMTEKEIKELERYEELIDNYPDLLKFIQKNYDRDLNKLKRKSPEKYNKFMSDLMNTRNHSIN